MAFDEKIQVLLDAATARRVREAAAKADRSVSSQMRLLIKQGIGGAAK